MVVLAIGTRWRLACEVGTCWPGEERLQTGDVRVILVLGFDSVKVCNQVLYGLFWGGKEEFGFGSYFMG